MKSVNQIVTCVCEEVKLSIEEELESKGCHHINLSEVFRPMNIFEGLETEYLSTDPVLQRAFQIGGEFHMDDFHACF